MNYGTVIKKSFNYLKQYGFKRKTYSKNTDYEINYEKGSCIIEVYYNLCYSEKENKQYFASFIILSINGERK